MRGNTSFDTRHGIACLALLAGVAVYGFTRVNPPALLADLLPESAFLSTHTGLFGSAPSLFYTLAVGLLLGSFATSLAAGRWHCLAWTVLALGFELTQLASIATPLADLLATALPAVVMELIGPYWTRGVFDPSDLLATVIGGTLALVLLTRLPGRHRHGAVR